MTFNPEIHHRKSIRLRTYDYSQGGWFFVTLNLKNNKQLFGKVIGQNGPFENRTMELNEAGKNANKCWLEIPLHFQNAIIHEFVIMPDHVHGIIEIRAVPNIEKYIESGKFHSPSGTIGSIIRGYKIGVTNWFRQYQPDRFPKGKPVWHRNYFEKIIRNQKTFDIYTNYIRNNPANYYK